jgi:hypothetical protein
VSDVGRAMYSIGDYVLIVKCATKKVRLGEHPHPLRMAGVELMDEMESVKVGWPKNGPAREGPFRVGVPGTVALPLAHDDRLALNVVPME